MAHEEFEFSFVLNPDGGTNLSEADILELAKPTSATWGEVFRAVLMPEKVKGLRVLDIGGGASDAVDRLVKLGADAYSIDPRYAQMNQLKGDMRLANKDFDKDARSMRNSAVERFKQSTKVDRDRYIEASATSIPFPDNHFDIVFSRLTILYYLDIDREILTKAIDECFRVVKPGGTIRLAPYKYIEPNWQEINGARMENNEFVFNRLKQSGAAVEVLDLKDTNWELLVAEKTASSKFE